MAVPFNPLSANPDRIRRATASSSAADASIIADRYCHAVIYACDKAYPPPTDLPEQDQPRWRRDHHWHPHQLRHNAATRLRKEFGLDVAQVVLGHKTLAVTQVYAEKNMDAAIKVMLEVG
jgi:integrase